MTFLELVRRLTFRRRDKFGKSVVGSERAERKLRVETLENRELLSATTGAEGPYTVITFDEYCESVSVVSAPAQSANRYAPSFADMMKAISAIEVQKNGSSQTALDPQFQPTVIDGQECCSLTQLEVLQAVYSNYGLNDSDTVSDVEQELASSGDGSENSASGSEQEFTSSSGGSGGGDSTYWPFFISSQVGSSHVDSSISVSNAIQERYDSSSSSSSLAGDYVVVTAPALPASFYSTVTLEGTASYGVDYNLYVSTSASGIHGINVSNNTFSYSESGGSTQFYLVPLNDSLVEQDEVATLSFGAIQEPVSGGGDYYFDYLSTSGSATIVDDDHWEVSISAVDQDGAPLSREYDEDGTILPITLSEANEDAGYFAVTRSDDGSNRSGDYSYPISYTLDFSGQTNSNDIEFEYYDAASSTWQTADLSAVLSIPASSVSAASLRVTAYDDSLVERFKETTSLSVESAFGVSSSVSYAADPSCETFAIVDNDALEVTSVSFKDNLNLVSDTQGTIGVSWKDGTHWTLDNPEATLPVAYSCDNTLKCQATITGLKDDSLTYQIKAEWSIGDSNDESGWISLSDSSVIATFTRNFITALGSRQALYEGSFKITWKFRVEGEEEREIGKSSNPLYVTYKTPLLNEIYHTAIHTACVAFMHNINSVVQENDNSSSSDTDNATSVDDASQQNEATSSSTNTVEVSERNAFDAIWSAFSSRRIPKINLSRGNVEVRDQFLSYYGRPPVPSASNSNLYQGTPYTDDLSTSPRESLARQHSNDGATITLYISGLLTHLDGTCGAWSNFAIVVYASQGIATSYVSITAKTNPNYGQYYFQVPSTLLGQGSDQSPRENIWINHALICYDNIVWDPSYGINYGVLSAAKQNFVN